MQHNKIVVAASVNAVQFPNSYRTPNWQNPNSFPRQNNRSTLYCSNCGGIWLRHHRNKFIAKCKTCNNCGLLSHFAKICRKQKKAKPQNSKKKTVNIVEEEPHPEDSVTLVQSAELYESDYSSWKDNTVAVIENAVEKVEPLNMPSRSVILILVDTWTPVAHAVSLIIHSHCKWCKVVLALSESAKRRPRNFGLSRMNNPGRRKDTISNHKQRMDLRFSNIHCCI